MRIFAADAASSPRAHIPILARTPIASARCGRSTADTPTTGRRYDRDYPGRNRDARATLYEGPNLSGRAFPLNDAVANLGRAGFNDRASSLRVESGYWIFCSDSEFRGECRTFGPGEYASSAGPQQRDLVGPADLELLSVRRQARLARQRIARRKAR